MPYAELLQEGDDPPAADDDSAAEALKQKEAARALSTDEYTPPPLLPPHVLSALQDLRRARSVSQRDGSTPGGAEKTATRQLS